jgi:phage-related protein
MYEVIFYQDSRGRQPVYEYLKELLQKKDKNSRVNANKINDYIQMLSEYGARVGEPYVKHLAGEIWELRPLRNRILFAIYNKRVYILLHYFKKQTQKTPRREIEQAERNLLDFKRRSD